MRAYLDDGVHHVYDLLETPVAQARLDQGDWLVLDTTQLPVDTAVDRILAHGGVTAPAAPG